MIRKEFPSLFQEILDSPLNIGARHVLRNNPDQIKIVDVIDEGIYKNINTPDEYEKLVT